MTMLGHITYLCPECGEELHKGGTCPHCNRKAKPYDLYAEALERQKNLNELDEGGN